MTTQIPRSTAENAFDLLSEICALILEEPKRLDMNRWKVSSANVDVDDDELRPRLGFPDCGTVGCIGGWTEILRGVRTSGQRGQRAHDILGLSDGQVEELFYDDDLTSDGEFHGQTIEHAEKTVEHVRDFQDKYRAQLLAKKV